MKRALLSVYNKKGVIKLAQKLILLNYEIISTGGTLQTLLNHDIKAIAVSQITGFPEILDGRVKTLHPNIHAAILANKDDQKHLEQLQKMSINTFDFVAINLYPFQETVEKESSSWKEIIEQIDIGGPAMIRASAKNYHHIIILTDPDDYDEIIQEIEFNGETSIETRLKLAQKAFQKTAEYDNYIAKTFKNKNFHFNCDGSDAYMDIPESHSLLRYGENPHQKASFILKDTPMITKLHGKELSYNNYLDLDAALKTIYNFSQPTVAIFKHTNPCGIASDNDLTLAYQKAFDTDKISPFGGIIIANRNINRSFAEKSNSLFTEMIIGPSFDHEAISLLKKKKERRIILYQQHDLLKICESPCMRSCLNGVLFQDHDLLKDNLEEWTYPTIVKPTEHDIDELLFAWNVVKSLKSNAIAFTNNHQTIALGSGQTSRIDSLNLAIHKAKSLCIELSSSYCASDGFFPFRDSIDILAQMSVRYVIQPGGSKADSEVIKVCDDNNICMIFTHRRHFKH